MSNVIRIIAIGLALFSNIIFASCQKKILKVVLEKKNPVEYIYNSPVDSLHSIISRQVEINNMMLWDSQQGSMILEEVSNMFSQKGNSLDFCLESINYIGKSKIYFAKSGGFFDYQAWFYIHLESIDSTHTKVRISTFEPEIIVGRELLPRPPHFVRRDKTLTVEPSTIEEYEILLKIGNLLEEKNMPSLILPNEKNKVEIVKH
jgi:hypothetical protein